MPELPEIETVKLQLNKALVGKKIVEITINNAKTFQGDKSLIEGKKVTAVRRRAKVLIIDVEEKLSVAFHFKMSGQLILDQDGNTETIKDRVVGGHPTADFVGKLPSSHTRVIFKLDRGMLYFNDQRKFGWVKVFDEAAFDQSEFFKGLGKEPWDMTEEEFMAKLKKSKKAIKLVIMDQTVISGVGNIYANDALWEAQISPSRPSNSLTDEEGKLLFEKIKLVLEEGIKYGGATAADAKYIDLHGLGGHYQEHFRTYDQQGKACKRCGNTIEKFVMGGRGTYWCAMCQK